MLENDVVTVFKGLQHYEHCSLHTSDCIDVTEGFEVYQAGGGPGGGRGGLGGTNGGLTAPSTRNR